MKNTKISPISLFLAAVRKKQGLTMEYAEGLCGKGELNRIEKGDRIPPKLLLEALLERLGVSMEYYGVVYSKRGYELEQRKQRIQGFLNNDAFEEAEQHLQELEKVLAQEEKLSLEEFTGSLDKKSVWKLWKQFFCHVRLCLCLGRGTPAGELKEGALEAIRLTVPGFPDRVTEETRYDKEELSLLSFYGDLLWQDGEREDSLRLCQYLCDYAWEKIVDRTEKVKIYPGLLVKLAQKKHAADQTIDGMYANSLALLREEHKSFFLAEWLRFREESGEINKIREICRKDELFALKGMADQPESREFQKAEKEAISFFQLLLQKENLKGKLLYLSWQGEGHKTFANYQFFSFCQQQNMTNEMLATLDVTSHTLSRLEQGEGIRQSTYQVILLYQAIIDKRTKRRGKEELQADLEKAFYLTVPKDCNIEHYPLSQMEIIRENRGRSR